MIAQALEAAMLICFGLSWPLNAYKNYQARTAAGTSWQFILLITLGYVAGIAAKYVSGQINWVLIVYYLNLVFLGVNWIVYFRNTKLDRSRLQESGGETLEPNEEPSRVLIACDGSKASLDAARFALSALDLKHAAVDVVSVVASDTPQARDVGEQNVRKTATLLADQGVECSSEVRQGKAPDEIIAAANEKQADLVVMGCRGLSGLQSAVMGSVSRTVAEYTDKPVLIVK
ncbi:MAG: universal stress protein [Eggerthellaceae bacterium]